MSNLERQQREAKRQRNMKVDYNKAMRENARRTRDELERELRRAKEEQKKRQNKLYSERHEIEEEKKRERQSMLNRQRADTEEKWSRRSEEKSIESSEESEYEYVYVDEDGNYIYGSDDEYEYIDEDDDHATQNVVFSERSKPSPESTHSKQDSTKKPNDRGNLDFSRIDMKSFLDYFQNQTECIMRNLSHVARLRDDHQANLKQQRESLKERRKEKREKKTQEMMDDFLEKENKRVELSHMSSAERLEQKEYQKNLTKALQYAEKRMKESDGKEFDIIEGSKVMARYEKKPQLLPGIVTRTRSDGSFDIKYDNGAEEQRVERMMIIPMAVYEGNAEGSKKDPRKLFEDYRNRALAAKEQQKQHFLELYAKREEIRRAEAEAEEEEAAEEQKVQARVVGSDCESKACGACKALTEEFAQMVFTLMKNKKVKSESDVFDHKTTFCSSPEVTGKYTRAVGLMCEKMFESEERKQIFIKEFPSWENALEASSLLRKKEKICGGFGICEDSSFRYERRKDDGWGSDRCFICHAIMQDLEEKASIFKKIDERNSLAIAKKSCDNLELDDKLGKICSELTSGISLIEVAWILKIHYEQIQKGVETFRNFPDVACEKLSLCERWVDPDTELTSVLDEVEHIYS